MDDKTTQFGTGAPDVERRRIFRRSVLLGIAGLVVLAAGAWVFFGIVREGNKKESAIDAAIKASDSAFQSGDYEKSLNELKKVTDQASSKQDKVDLYANLAASAASAGKMNEAIDYMKEKHAVDPDTAQSDAYLVGSYYERLGESQKAIEQYKISIEYYKSLPQNASTEARIRSLEARITSLGG